jgi:hypothetical protein
VRPASAQAQTQDPPYVMAGLVTGAVSRHHLNEDRANTAMVL